MTDKRASAKKAKVEKLELNKETVQDLTESEAQAAAGGQVFHPRSPLHCGVSDQCRASVQSVCGIVCLPTELDCPGPCAPGGPTAVHHARRGRGGKR